MWAFYKLNYYGGRLFRHPEGWKAIEIFNYYYQPIGFEVFDENFSFVGRVKAANELP